MMGRIQKGLVRSYLAYKRVLSDIKGSPTMEYIIILAVGALFAGILYNVFVDESISNKIKTFIMDKINGATGGGQGNQANPGN